MVPANATRVRTIFGGGSRSEIGEASPRLGGGPAARIDQHIRGTSRRRRLRRHGAGAAIRYPAHRSRSGDIRG